jgi:hypothetical protein
LRFWLSDFDSAAFDLETVTHWRQLMGESGQIFAEKAPQDALGSMFGKG